jgi:uncharacterized protein YcbX
VSAAVTGLWRYPVKSMRGEACDAFDVAVGGIVGDRRYALVDVATGKVASAKNPRLWSALLGFSAAYVDGPAGNGVPPRVAVSFPGGARRTSDEAALEAELRAALGRDVRLSATAPAAPVLEEYWPDLDDLAHRDVITEEAMPPATFFDCASVHLLTTNTLEALRERYPDGAFEVARFRPNILVSVADGGAFAEDAWVGAEVRIGADVVLRVTGPAPRCVMTTLAQPGLPADLGVLRTAAQHHAASVGVYAEVVHGGAVARGDALVRAS